MKRYYSLLEKMSFAVIVVDVCFPLLIFYILFNEKGIGIIFLVAEIILVLILINYCFIYLYDQCFKTYYNNNGIMQKLFFKIKRINYEEIKYVYIIGVLVVLSKNNYNFQSGNTSIRAAKKAAKTMKKEVCISYTTGDRSLADTILKRCSDAIKIDIRAKSKYIRNFFDLDRTA